MTSTTSSSPQLATTTIGAELDVSRVGYGAMQLTGDHVWGEYPDRDGAIALLRGVVESGITFIDTADVYGPHTNEILIHDALHPYPDELVIATKGGFVRGGYDYSTLGAVGNPNYLRQSAHMSARRLGVEQIDLYYLHSGTATDVPFVDQVATLAELREQGLIRNIGLSNVTLEQFNAACEIVEIAAVTAHYNVSVRRGAALLAAASRAGSVFSPWHPVRLNEGPDARADRRDRSAIRRHPPTDRSGVAAAPIHHHAPDSRHDQPRAPHRQHPGRDDPTRAARRRGRHRTHPRGLTSMDRTRRPPGAARGGCSAHARGITKAELRRADRSNSGRGLAGCVSRFGARRVP
jgi:pyridoxine 4-dehydrogenase